jgi:hypothetical protein
MQHLAPPTKIKIACYKSKASEHVRILGNVYLHPDQLEPSI